MYTSFPPAHFSGMRRTSAVKSNAPLFSSNGDQNARTLHLLERCREGEQRLKLFIRVRNNRAPKNPSHRERERWEQGRQSLYKQLCNEKDAALQIFKEAVQVYDDKSAFSSLLQEAAQLDGIADSQAAAVLIKHAEKLGIEDIPPGLLQKEQEDTFLSLLRKMAQQDGTADS